jgi:hypothetical protein
MNWDDLTLAEQRLLLAADEGTELGHITLPERIAQSDGSYAELPAKDPEECSRILLHWFGQGYLTVYRFPGNDEMSKADARALLADPERWGPDAGVSLTSLGNHTLPTARLR